MSDRLKVDNGIVLNKQEVIDFINNCFSLLYLEELAIGIEEYIVQYGGVSLDMEEILKIVSNRIKKLSSSKKQTKNNPLVILRKLSLGANLTAEEYKFLTIYVNNLMFRFKQGDISNEERRFLDGFVSIISDFPKEEINPKWKSVMYSYYATINEEALKKISDAKKQQNECKIIRLRPLNDSKGIILTVSIIDVTVLIGLFIAILLIAL